MEQELFFTGYCRCLDAGRTVEVILEDRTVTVVDCAYPQCLHRSVCPIARQIDEHRES